MITEHLDIGGVRIELQRPTCLRPAGPALTRHAIEPGPGGTAELEIRVEPASPRDLPATGGFVFEAGEDGGLRFTGQEGAGRVRYGADTTWVVARLGEGFAEIDGLVFLALAAHLAGPRRRAERLLVHASAVRRAGALYLFCGPSGVGKTTVALELPGEGEPWSVDRVVVAAPDGGPVLGWATPFGERAAEAVGTAAPVPVAGLFFLEQAAAPAVEPLGPAALAQGLLTNTVAPVRDTDRSRDWLALAERIARRVPGGRLRFSRDPGFWPLVEAAVRRAAAGRES